MLTRGRNALLPTFCNPLLNLRVPIHRIKRRQIRDNPRAQQHIPGNLRIRRLQIIRRLSPPHLLTSQSINQLLSTVQFHRTHLHISFQPRFVVLLHLQVCIQRRKLILNLLQLRLLHRKSTHHLFKRLLRLRKSGLLRRHHLRHPVIRLHRTNPTTQPERSRRSLLNLHRIEVRIRHIRPDLLNNRWGNIILIESPQTTQEVRIRKHLFRRLPVIVHHFTRPRVLHTSRFQAFDDTDRLQNQLHRLRRALHTLHLCNVVLRQRIQSLDRSFQHRHCLRKLPFAVIFNRLHLGSFRARHSLFLRDDNLHFVSLRALLCNHNHSVVRLLSGLNQLRLQGF
mmetsp:Transcript_25264/g.30598  ORF Transcript_25264/g.30598 Transcript_25264/m.30598 type:complete len:338 (-) Transcript_25264:1969-2982(-)